jgi:hypothetical protein
LQDISELSLDSSRRSIAFAFIEFYGKRTNRFGRRNRIENEEKWKKKVKLKVERKIMQGKCVWLLEGGVNARVVSQTKRGRG